MSRRRGAVELFLLLYGFWLLLSWRLDPLFLVLGALSAAGVTWLTGSLVHAHAGWVHIPLRKLPIVAVRLASYTGWMLARMVTASVQVAYFVLSPKMPLDPAVVRFPVQLHSPMARTFLAHSITLIPGTMTVELDEDECVVHTLVPSAADDLIGARMQRKIAAIFLDDAQSPVEAIWEQPREDRP